MFILEPIVLFVTQPVNVCRSCSLVFPKQVASIASVIDARSKPQEAKVMTRDMTRNGMPEAHFVEEAGTVYYATVLTQYRPASAM
jgi:hypothetical protein